MPKRKNTSNSCNPFAHEKLSKLLEWKHVGTHIKTELMPFSNEDCSLVEFFHSTNFANSRKAVFTAYDTQLHSNQGEELMNLANSFLAYKSDRSPTKGNVSAPNPGIGPNNYERGSSMSSEDNRVTNLLGNDSCKKVSGQRTAAAPSEEFVAPGLVENPIESISCQQRRTPPQSTVNCDGMEGMSRVSQCDVGTINLNQGENNETLSQCHSETTGGCSSDEEVDDGSSNLGQKMKYHILLSTVSTHC
ncbi:hypothetical protein QAD02_020471 [Eretmocerus hayati]|uniref:Uncharacterized protein n=1 Tax=Eretmocerus hayati TaxID=131215 RepID=A0ACC2PNI8_9HYME|nr:hypothetical protein QAD02_020471 [Eretmocerus hayati]